MQERHDVEVSSRGSETEKSFNRRMFGSIADPRTALAIYDVDEKLPCQPHCALSRLRARLTLARRRW